VASSARVAPSKPSTILRLREVARTMAADVHSAGRFRTRRPRVAHLTAVDITLRYQLLDELSHLRQAGYDIELVSSDGANVPALRQAGFVHHAVRMTRQITPLADVATVLALTRLFRREHFEAVHTHTPKAAALGQIAARLAGVPTIINTVHGFYFHERTPPLARIFYAAIERVVAGLSDRILLESHEDLRTASRMGIDSERLVWIGGGINLARFDPARLDQARLSALRRELGIPHDALVIGFVGRLVKEKGVLDLLHAARTIQSVEPRAYLLVVGATDAEKTDAAWPEIARRLGVCQVVFSGIRTDLPDLYGVMHAFALPSAREGLPRTLMEANAMRIACVASNVRGCRDIIQHDVNGLLVECGDVAQLANTLLRLLRDSNLRRRLGDAGRSMALSRFDERELHARLLREYARLMSAPEETLALPLG
jgi:glycosyltransferase involved in cell wall biosynthesis